jgi:predicted ATPase with chaperone activity
MLAKVNSAALYGIDALRVEVEIDLASGLPQLATVGLPEGAVKESKDRIRAAVKNCGYTFPAKRITINLAPADIKKEGSAYDLPMAVGILAAEGLIQKNLLDDYFLIGELSLSTVQSSPSVAPCPPPWRQKKKNTKDSSCPRPMHRRPPSSAKSKFLGFKTCRKWLSFSMEPKRLHLHM